MILALINYIHFNFSLLLFYQKKKIDKGTTFLQSSHF